MSKPLPDRYNNLSVSLHWLMAVLIIGMLAIGKYMVGLEESDSMRFFLTQWHKTFGVLILFLALFRLLWRFSHKAPAHPAAAPKWEIFAANFSHIALYALLFLAPITGWMLVSASSLNVDTLLFNVIPWPHIPWLHNMENKATSEGLYYLLHEIATGALIALLLVHIAAALKHHIIDKDTVLTRMLPSSEAGTGKTMLSFTTAFALLVGGSVFAYSQLTASNQTLSSGTSQVSAIASVMGDETPINFLESTVNAKIDANNLESSTLNASVPTASLSSPNSQVEGSLPDGEWFDSANFPTATFESTSISLINDSVYSVEGLLTIKEISLPQSFELTINQSETGQMATGEFVVDRMAYNLGMDSQASGDYVGQNVTITFQFELLTAQ